MTVKYAPHTSSSAYARAKAKVDAHATNVVGMCAHEIIVNILGIPGPWKWGGTGSTAGKAYAINYFLGAQKVVKTSDPAKVPAGAVVIWGPRPGATTAGGKAGHIAIGAGGGYCYSTDMGNGYESGRWGKVTIAHIEAAWTKPLVGYVLIDGMGYTLTDPPKLPAKPIVPWFTGLCWNEAASDDVHGKVSWDTRVPALIKAIKYYDRDVLHLVETETAGTQGAAFRAALKAAGWEIAVADNQRLIAVRKGIKIGRTRIVTLAEKGPANDDKQVVLAEVFPTNDNAVVLEAGHLEFRDGTKYDKVRVTQGKQAKAATIRFAKDCGIPYHRIFSYNDENSGDQVSTKAYGSTFPDAHERDTYIHPQYSTLLGWDGKPLTGSYRPDKVRFHKDRPGRAGTSITQASKKLSDHLPLTYTAGSL